MEIKNYSDLNSLEIDALREIGSIMNDSVTGWEKGAQHRFEIYGQQRSWRRVKAEAFPLIEEQLALPDGWA